MFILCISIKKIIILSICKYKNFCLFFTRKHKPSNVVSHNSETPCIKKSELTLILYCGIMDISHKTVHEKINQIITIEIVFNLKKSLIEKNCILL